MRVTRRWGSVWSMFSEYIKRKPDREWETRWRSRTDPRSHRPAVSRHRPPELARQNDTPQRIAMTRRTWVQRRGQFWLTEETGLVVPFPVRTWPKPLRQREAAAESDSLQRKCLP